MTKTNASATPKADRRRFLALAGATAAATVAAPNVANAQTVTLRFQSTWPQRDIFHEFCNDYATRVNAMTGGRLRLEVLAAGAVVPAFQLQDAVHAGILDGGHGVTAYWFGKNKAYSLFGTPPSYGWDAHNFLGWMNYGGGYDLYNELLTQITRVNVVGFLTGPMPCQPFGWFKREITQASELRGLKYRTVGLAADLFQQMGAKVTQLPGGEIIPALEKGVIDAFEFNNPTSDMRFGAQDVIKNYMMGSYHQAMEFFEIAFNKKKHDSLPKDLQAILRYGVEAANSSNWWTAMDNYSRDLQELMGKHKVNVLRTPKAVFVEQLKAWDVLTKKLSDEDPFFKKVVESQLAWAKRVAYYMFVNEADYALGYEHVHKVKLPTA